MTTRRQTRTTSPGFTLLELLVVVAIIGMIAAFSLAAVFGAQQAARETHTQGIISKLHNQMALRIETYQTRRLPLIYPDPNITPETAQQFAVRQLVARRELMRMELPDQYIDLIFQPVAYGRTDPTNAPYDPANDPNPPDIIPILMGGVIPALRVTYQQRVEAVRLSGESDIDLFDRLAEQNESAECLYMILTTGMTDQSSGGQTFSERDIDDTDGDGMPEFIDGWGNPIEWIRWPAGFTSPLQPVLEEPLNFSAANLNNVVTQLLDGPNRESDERHDPFDLWRLDADPSLNSIKINYSLDAAQQWFATFPLIISPGRDEQYGIFFVRQGAPDELLSNPTLYPEYSDPYSKLTNSTGTDVPRGMVDFDADGFGRGHQDNIHNHSIATN